MDNVTKLLLQGASGAGGDGDYIDDLFDQHLWNGTNTNKTITNGIDLLGEGGMTWIKTRNVSDTSRHWTMCDTERGANRVLKTNNADEEQLIWETVKNFYNTGYRIGGAASVNFNTSDTYVGYTFRKAKGFFDVVTWNGNDTAGHQIPHNLGSVPGCIMIKCRSTAWTDWIIYHRGLNSGSTPEDYWINFHTSGQQNDPHFNDTAPTATHFEVGGGGNVNASGRTYVAYVFGHNDGDGTFGSGGNNDIISCGYYNGNGNGSEGPGRTLGWEPQWLLIKNFTNSGNDWVLQDTLRGMPVGEVYNANSGRERVLFPNQTSTEILHQAIDISATGWRIMGTGDSRWNAGGQSYIYIAIRGRDGLVGKPATAGNDVFQMDTGASGKPAFDSGFPVDYVWRRAPNSPHYIADGARLLGPVMGTPGDFTGDESDTSTFDYTSNTGFGENSSSSYQAWMWRRGPGCDIVQWTGDNTAGRQIPHSLGAIPEMIMVQCRTSTNQDYPVYHVGLNGGVEPWKYYLYSDSSQAQSGPADQFWNQTAPTKTHFSVNNSGEINSSGNGRYRAVLFTSVAGISKCGYYAGDGSTSHTITTGFTPRFLMIKVIDASNSWFIYDSLRGLGSGADPYLQLENNNVQASSGDDVFNVSGTGFTIIKNYSSVNASGSNYIYYAHA